MEKKAEIHSEEQTKEQTKEQRKPNKEERKSRLTCGTILILITIILLIISIPRTLSPRSHGEVTPFTMESTLGDYVSIELYSFTEGVRFRNILGSDSHLYFAVYDSLLIPVTINQSITTNRRRDRIEELVNNTDPSDSVTLEVFVWQHTRNVRETIDELSNNDDLETSFFPYELQVKTTRENQADFVALILLFISPAILGLYVILRGWRRLIVFWLRE